MANLVGKYMKEQTKIKFIESATVDSIKGTPEGRKKVNYRFSSGKTGSEEYDTVLYATGREIDTDNLLSPSLNVQFNPKNKKIITNQLEQSNLEWLYALGDCAQDRPELTPPAIRAGKLLAERLFGGSKEVMDYTLVATTVFTPIEYSACGLSEEDAIA